MPLPTESEAAETSIEMRLYSADKRASNSIVYKFTILSTSLSFYDTIIIQKKARLVNKKSKNHSSPLTHQ